MMKRVSVSSVCVISIVWLGSSVLSLKNIVGLVLELMWLVSMVGFS